MSINVDSNIDAVDALIRFIKAKNILRGAAYTYDININDCRVLTGLFKDDEVIKTDGNEIAKVNGESTNRTDFAYEYLYALLEENRLLSICFKRDLKNGSTSVHFVLHPNADKMRVEFRTNASIYPYLIIFNEDGSIVSNYSFEKTREKYNVDYSQNLRVSDFINPIDISLLEERVSQRTDLYK